VAKLVDVGLVQPVARAAFGDSEILGDLRDGLRSLTIQLDSAAVELWWMRTGHLDSCPSWVAPSLEKGRCPSNQRQLTCRLFALTTWLFRPIPFTGNLGRHRADLPDWAEPRSPRIHPSSPRAKTLSPDRPGCPSRSCSGVVATGWSSVSYSWTFAPP
jgi:hypothetical protein